MKKFFCIHAHCSSLLIFLILVLGSSICYSYNYYIDEPRFYASGNCGAKKDDDRPDRTYPIRNGLIALGWTGSYFTGTMAWPQDFIDKSVINYPDGLDHIFADNGQLSVFSGHGDSGYIHYSNSHTVTVDNVPYTRCGAGDNFHDNGVVIGAATGDQSANMIVIACCYLNPNQLGWIDGGGTTQIMGYGSLSFTDAGMVEDFFNASQGSTNKDAWLDNMEDKPYWFTGDNTAAVLTKGWTWDDVNWNVSHCKLKGGVCWSPWTYDNNDLWQLDYLDHGCDDCTGC